MNYIKLEVSCQRNNRKETVYYYLTPTTQPTPIFNGCDNLCGSLLCTECAKIHQKEAEETVLQDLRYIDTMTIFTSD